MSWKLIDRPKTQKVTKSIANAYAEMDAAPHDRPLSERRLQVYERLLRAGQFRPVTWASVLCKETGGVYRVNGKHTSILLSGIDKIPEFYVTIEEYECDTLEDVAKLYATFDSTMQQRTARDIYASFAGTVPELMVLPSKVINASPGAISFALRGGDKGEYGTPSERAELLLDHVGFVSWTSSIICHDKGRYLSRQPVVAAMFTTFQKSMKAANEFWLAVRDETGTSPTMADRKVSRYLLTTGSRKDSRTYKTATSNREVYVKCLHGWNAWRKSESTNLTYYPESKIPAIV